jgi:hypothetical protein
MSAETKWKVGDEAWLPKRVPRDVRLPCPVCFGQKVVTVILGNGEAVQTPCDCCGAGFEGPRGYVVDWTHDPAVERVRIIGVRCEEGEDTQETEYRIRDNGIARDADLFADEADALAAAKVRVAEQADWDDKRLRSKKDQTLKKASWLVGYHRRGAKECRRKAEYHDQRAALARARGES